MTIDSNLSDGAKTSLPSSVEFALEPRSFVENLARRMGIDVSEATLLRLTERITRGTSREQIIRNLQNIKGEQYPPERSVAALNFARLGHSTSALVIESIISFAPKDEKAFVLYAYSQVLGRHPSDVELARLTHQLQGKTISRIGLLEILNDKSIEEGRQIIWDSSESLESLAEPADRSGAIRLLETTGYRTLSHDSPLVLTLCRYTPGQWELAPSMVSCAEEVRSDSWIVNDGFILTGPKCHLPPGIWLLELDIVQPEWASIVVDVVANLGVDRLFYLTAYGNLRGSFVFEKFNTHAFLEVRLQCQDTIPGQWISIQSVRLRKIG